MNFKSKKNIKNLIITLLSVLFFVMAFKYLVDFIDLRIDYLLDDDMSSELVLGNLVAKERRFIFSNNWYYSTELRTINIQIIFALLFRFFSNWHFVRVQASVVCYLILCASMFLLLRIIGTKRYSVVGASLLLLPTSSVYFYVVSGGLFYIPHIVLSLVTISMIILVDKNRFILSLLLLIFGIATGVGGYRYLLVLFLPVFGSSLLIYLYNIFNNKNNNEIKSLLINSTVSLCGGLLGYLLNSMVLSKQYEYGFYTSVKPMINGFEKLKLILYGFIKDFGYVSTMGTKAKLFTLICSMFVIFLWIVSTYKILKRDRYSVKNKFYAMFSILNIMAYTSLNMITTMHFEERYLILCTVFMIPTIIIYLDSIKKENISLIIVVILVASFVIPTSYTYKYNKYNNTNNSLKEIVTYIDSLGYNNVYSTVAYGNMITELSNGNIRAYKFETSYDEQARDFENHNVWLQRIDNDTDKPEGKVCLFLKYYNPGMDEHIIYWENDDAVVYGFESYEQMKEVIYSLGD